MASVGRSGYFALHWQRNSPLVVWRRLDRRDSSAFRLKSDVKVWLPTALGFANRQALTQRALLPQPG